MIAEYDLVKEEDKSFDVDYTIWYRIRNILIRLFEMSVDVNELIIERVTS